jgi:glycosyltransferase involved in cell wall biosynthesis
VFPPVGGATGALVADLAADLTGRGWTVSVLTSAVDGESRRTWTERGVQVHRVAGRPVSRASHWKRALAYGSLYPRFLARALQLPRHDVVVTKTDPPLQLVLGPVIQQLKGSALVHWAQDLYPEVAEALGVFETDGLLARAFRAASTWALQRHDRVVAVGRCMEDRIRNRGLQREKTTVIPNWPLGTVHPVPPGENSFRAARVEDGHFVVMYSGNMGLAHPFEAMIEAATRLNRDHPGVRFLLVGKGPRRDWIENAVERRRLDNVSVLPFQPEERLAESLSAADLHLVSMRAETKGLVVPSKIYGVMAAGCPCLFLGPTESEAARVVTDQQCGEVLSEPDGEELARRIVWWKEHAQERHAAGRRARAAVEDAREEAADRFETVLTDVVSKRVPK